MSKFLHLKKIFSDGAILPRNKKLPVSGTATPGSHITVSLGNNHGETTASADGTFTVELAPMPAGGPYTLTAVCGDESVTASDIYIGEVFLCSGQSNMELLLSKQKPAPSEDEYTNPDIRFFRVPRSLLAAGVSDADAVWHGAENPENWPNITSVGFFTALHYTKAVPGIKIGIVDNSIGGSCIASWIDRDTLAGLPVYGERLARYEASTPVTPRTADGKADGGKILSDAISAKITDETPDITLEAVDYDDSSWREMNLPGDWTLSGIFTTGICCFRKHFHLPEDWQGKDLLLSLGGINQQDVTFVNGVEVGRSGSGNDFSLWNVCRKYRVPAEILHAGDNLIVVRAISKFYMLQGGGFSGPSEAMFITPADDENAEKIPLDTIWKLEQERAFPVTGWELQCCGEGMNHSLHILFDNVVRPIINYPVSAVIWYQGEADSTCPEMVKEYPMMLRALRSSWRKAWNEPDLPFYFVQLPGFMAEADYEEHALWAYTRNSQLLAALEEGSYPVVTSELGMEWEIHPPDKSEVGRRLTLLMLNKSGAEAHGPKLEKITVNSADVTITFSACGDGLQLRCGDKPAHWAVAGADKKFYPAEAVISSKTTVTVKSPQVPEPRYAAYGFSTNPARANLINSNGLPASPFRIKTDTMELV